MARFDPLTGHVQRSGSAAHRPASPTLTAPSGSRTVSAAACRIDPRTGSVRPIHVGNEPAVLAAAGRDVLATVLPSLASHRGGTLTLIAQLSPHDHATDPAVAYRSPLADAERDQRRAGRLPPRRRPRRRHPCPDLATALPAPADGGRTYSFHLRPGIRYSNGALVRPEDFRRAIERVFSHQHGGGAATFAYSAVSGAPMRADARTATSRAGSSPTTRRTRSPSTSPRRTRSSRTSSPSPSPTRSPPERPTTSSARPSCPPPALLTRSFVPRHAGSSSATRCSASGPTRHSPAATPAGSYCGSAFRPGPAVSAVEHGRADVLLTPPRRARSASWRPAMRASCTPALGRHLRACAEHPRLAVQHSRRAAGPQLRHRPEPR